MSDSPEAPRLDGLPATVSEAEYVMAICSGCGAWKAWTRPVGGAIQGSANYPKCCGGGGGVFVQTRIIAERRMTVTFKGDL